MENLPELLRQIRLRHGITQEQLAARLGVSFTSVNRWESGHVAPRAPQRAQLRELLVAEGLMPLAKMGQGGTQTHEQNTEVEELRSLFDQGDLDALVGRVESTVFEAKSCDAYNLEDSRARIELAKDVSALANSDGGYLVIGAKTEHVDATDEDRVVELELRAEDGFPFEKYHGCIREIVYGSISGLDVRWVGHREKPSAGLATIYVPRQPEERRPFLVAQAKSSGKTDGAVFGIFVRRGAGNVPYTAEQLRKAVRDGASEGSRRLSRIEQSLLRIEDVAKDLLPSAASTQGIPFRPATVDPLGAAIRRILESD